MAIWKGEDRIQYSSGQDDSGADKYIEAENQAFTPGNPGCRSWTVAFSPTHRPQSRSAKAVTKTMQVPPVSAEVLHPLDGDRASRASGVM